MSKADEKVLKGEEKELKVDRYDRCIKGRYKEVSNDKGKVVNAMRRR